MASLCLVGHFLPLATRRRSRLAPSSKRRRSSADANSWGERAATSGLGANCASESTRRRRSELKSSPLSRRNSFASHAAAPSPHLLAEPRPGLLSRRTGGRDSGLSTCPSARPGGLLEAPEAPPAGRRRRGRSSSSTGGARRELRPVGARPVASRRVLRVAAPNRCHLRARRGLATRTGWQEFAAPTTGHLFPFGPLSPRVASRPRLVPGAGRTSPSGTNRWPPRHLSRPTTTASRPPPPPVARPGLIRLLLVIISATRADFCAPTTTGGRPKRCCCSSSSSCVWPARAGGHSLLAAGPWRPLEGEIHTFGPLCRRRAARNKWPLGSKGHLLLGRDVDSGKRLAPISRSLSAAATISRAGRRPSSWQQVASVATCCSRRLSVAAKWRLISRRAEPRAAKVAKLVWGRNKWSGHWSSSGPDDDDLLQSARQSGAESRRRL